MEKKEQEKKNTQISKQNIKGEGGRKIEPRIKEKRRSKLRLSQREIPMRRGPKGEESKH